MGMFTYSHKYRNDYDEKSFHFLSFKLYHEDEGKCGNILRSVTYPSTEITNWHTTKTIKLTILNYCIVVGVKKWKKTGEKQICPFDWREDANKYFDMELKKELDNERKEKNSPRRLSI